MKTIRCLNLSKAYGKKTVVHGVSIAVNPGEVVGLLGPNGAGKTTTFYMMVGLVEPSGGQVFLGSREITAEPMYKRARLGIGYLPQEASVFRKLTVRENLLAVLELGKLNHRERAAEADRRLESLGLSHLAGQKAYTLSGGERRRLEISRALASEPSFLLMDEPFSGVDPISVHEVQEIVRRLKKEGIGVLITDHSVRETLEITDRAYLLYEGRVLAEGDRDFLINDPQSRRAYLGENFRL